MKSKLTILIIISMTFFLAACMQNKTQPTPPVEDESQAPLLAENQILDGAGRILDLPEDPQNATLASAYAVAVPFIKALDLGSRVLAINTKSVFWQDNDSGLAAAGTVGRGVIDLEALANFNPTVLIHRANDAQTTEAVEALGIPVLSIKAESIDDIKSTLNLLGSYFGVMERADELNNYIDTKFAYIEQIVSAIAPEDKPTALFLGSQPARIAGEDMLQAFMLEKAGAVSLNSGYSQNGNWLDIGLETVFELNPDYLFLTSSSPLDYTIDGLLTDEAWSAVTAVQNQDIYQIPAKIDSWDLPGVNAVIGTMYILHQLHPEHFSAEQLQTEIDEYYQLIFGQTFAADYLGYQL